MAKMKKKGAKEATGPRNSKLPTKAVQNVTGSSDLKKGGGTGKRGKGGY